MWERLKLRAGKNEWMQGRHETGNDASGCIKSAVGWWQWLLYLFFFIVTGGDHSLINRIQCPYCLRLLQVLILLCLSPGASSKGPKTAGLQMTRSRKRRRDKEEEEQWEKNREGIRSLKRNLHSLTFPLLHDFNHLLLPFVAPTRSSFQLDGKKTWSDEHTSHILPKETDMSVKQTVKTRSGRLEVQIVFEQEVIFQLHGGNCKEKLNNSIKACLFWSYTPKDK